MRKYVKHGLLAVAIFASFWGYSQKLLKIPLKSGFFGMSEALSQPSQNRCLSFFYENVRETPNFHIPKPS